MAMVGQRRGEVPWFKSPFFADIWDPFEIGLPDLAWEGYDDNKADVDWRETDKAHFFHADLPGVRKEDVKVQVEDGNVLQISGDRRKEEGENPDDDKWDRAERQSGSFLRRFRLPENSKLDEIKCRLENGLLSVVVPKKDTEENRKTTSNVNVA